VREVDGEKGKHQIPIYFVSEALSGSMLLYSELEKIAYAVVMATRKLRHYFEAHRVSVLTEQPVNNLFINKELRPESPNGQQSCRSTQSILGRDQQSNPKYWQISWWIGPHLATLFRMRNWCLCGKSDVTELGGAKVPELQPLSLHQQGSS
jgi:hypothetical protein